MTHQESDALVKVRRALERIGVHLNRRDYWNALFWAISLQHALMGAFDAALKERGGHRAEIAAAPEAGEEP